MKLNHNSISARLYRWFYLTDDMPQNLCPYFWKLVIAWVFTLPVGLICLPMFIFKQRESMEWGIRLLIGFLLWGMIFVCFLALFPVTYFFWGWFKSGTIFRTWQGAGIFIWMLTIIVAAVFGIIHLIEKRKAQKRHLQREWIWNDEGDYVRNPDYSPHEEKPNIIIEFIKAKYNKYCPKIEWNK